MAKSPSKSTSQQRHAKRRAAERYDLDLHQDAQTSIIRAIQRREAKFIRRQSWRVSIFEVEHEGRILSVVYDTKRKTIVTVLPQEALEPEGAENDTSQ